MNEKRYIIILHPDGLNETHEVPESGPTLKELQKAVGGRIETVPSVLSNGWTKEPGARVILVINEEGKLNGLPINHAATDLSWLRCDHIAGSAVLCATKGEEIIGFSREAALNIRKRRKL